MFLFFIFTCVYLAWQNFYYTKYFFFRVCTQSSVIEKDGFNSFLDWLLYVFANELFCNTKQASNP